jgi:hypothetical protein
VVKPESAAQLTQTLGSSGLVRYAGYVIEDPLPKGEKAWTDVFIRMQSDAVVGAMLTAFETLANRVDWFWKPYDDTPQSAANLQFVEECWSDMDQPWADIISEIWTMLPFGWALLEQTYKKRQGYVTDKAGNFDPVHSSRFHDGRTGWAKWSLRSQETRLRWEFDDAGNVTGLVQLAPPTWKTVTLPMEKCLLFRTTARKGNPEGRSVLRPGYVSWARKTRIEVIEGIGIERDLAGLPVAEVPPELLDPDASDEEKALLAAIYKIVTSIKRDTNEGVVWPMEYDAHGKPKYNLRLLSTGGTRQFDTDRVVQRYEQRSLMSVLADFLFVGHESKGSFALIVDKARLFSDALEGYLDRIAAVINTYAAPRLLRVNGLPDDLAPTLEHGKVREIALDQLAVYIAALAKAGVSLTDPVLVERQLSLAHLPAPPAPEEDEQLEDVDDAASAETEAIGEGASLEVPA